MATLHQSSFDPGHDLKSSTSLRTPVLRDTWEQPTREPSPQQDDRALSELRREVHAWRLSGDTSASRAFVQKLKAVGETVEKAARYLLQETSPENVPGTDAAAILNNLRFLRPALREAKEALGDPDELPFVEDGDSSFILPRVYAVSNSYLSASEYSFEKSQFFSWMSVVQEISPLFMSETWNLKGALEFVLLERIAEAAGQFLKQRKFEPNLTSETLSEQLTRCANTLRQVLALDWPSYFEQIDQTESILRSDPQHSYGKMDSASREQYRSAVAAMAKHSKCSEHQIAHRAISLALEAADAPFSNPRIQERRTHVGYYLVGAGREILNREIGFKPSWTERIRTSMLRSPDYFYLIGIELAALAAIALLVGTLNTKSEGFWALALLLLPAAECAVGLANLFVTSFIPPKRLPRLDFSNGMPDNCSTIVAVPTLLTSEQQVRAAVKALEIRFLGNRDANLHFALVTDPPDSNQQFDEMDKLASLCSALIDDLNARYAKAGRGTFFHFHRNRTFNESEGVWMGWERKRGKILEFNRLLLGESGLFPVRTGNLSLLRGIRYVITLDLDTQLPPGSGHRLVGTLAHPQNAAVINPATNTVVEGYGILQPRIDISQASAVRSRLSSLFSGDTGFDMYTRAVSDVYQDLFGEGIFTGKGIYEVETFQRVLATRFPSNSILSHDLIEGAYARAGLVTDVEVIDDYPPDFTSFSRRKHRWIRGDWQIAPWLLPRVRDSFGRLVRNPTCHVSRWKIIDNLRRSVADIAILAALVFGWFCLPSKALQWTLAVLAISFVPSYLRLFMPVLKPSRDLLSLNFWKRLAADLAKTSALIACRLAFLFHQALVSLDAILRTLVRMNVTHERMLEWETAAEAESNKRRRHVIDSYLPLASFLSFALGVGVYFLRPASFAAAFPLLFVWTFLPAITRWLDGHRGPAGEKLTAADQALIRNAALRTWRFFREFSTQEENWLIPDIVRETPRLIAHRISTTNLGLLLNSRLVALDLGFTSVGEFVDDTEKTFHTIEHLPRCKGHLYNWYTTDTLEPVPPLFISTVDNGNLVCSLWTLQTGCREALSQRIFRPAMWRGVLDHIDLLEELISRNSSNQDLLFGIRDLKQKAAALAGEGLRRFESFPALEVDVAIFTRLLLSTQASDDIRWWAQELTQRVNQLVLSMVTFAPWLLPAYREVCALRGVGRSVRLENLTLEAVPYACDNLRIEIQATFPDTGLKTSDADLLNQLCEALEKSKQASKGFAARLLALSHASQSLADSMDFGFLYDPERKLLSIGYDAAEGAVSPWHYDLLPSEARAATFVGLAQGSIPQKTWFNLGRFRGIFKGDSVLLSWTGTMFEYMMPFLWMKPFRGSVLERGARGAILAQRKMARARNIPWGMSECSCNEQSSDGHYSYRAFGASPLAIHRDEFSNDVVVAPYATFLAMMLEPAESIQNLRGMRDLGWLGAYGFYEAADFTRRRVRQGRSHEIVRNWMAHHQGMSLIAADNVLCDSVMQKRFHDNPIVAAAERVLHERLPRLSSQAEEEIVEQVKPAAAQSAKDWAGQSRRSAFWRRDLSKLDEFNYNLSACFREKSHQ